MHGLLVCWAILSGRTSQTCLGHTTCHGQTRAVMQTSCMHTHGEQAEQDSAQPCMAMLVAAVTLFTVPAAAVCQHVQRPQQMVQVAHCVAVQQVLQALREGVQEMCGRIAHAHAGKACQHGRHATPVHFWSQLHCLQAGAAACLAGTRGHARVVSHDTLKKYYQCRGTNVSSCDHHTLYMPTIQQMASSSFSYLICHL